MPEWLERELSRGLAPVKAPDELWLRVSSGGAHRRRGRSHVFLAVAAGLLVTVGAIWLWGNPARNPASQVAAQGACYSCHTNL